MATFIAGKPTCRLTKNVSRVMKPPSLLSLLFLTAILASTQAADPLGTAPEREIGLMPGLNAVAITRFPPNLRDGAFSPELTLNSVFGPNNEAGLTPGDPQTADVIWIAQQGRWQRFYFSESTPVTKPGWRRIESIQRPEIDAGDFSWLYTDGVLIENRQKEPLPIVLNGLIKTESTILQVSKGWQYFNRVYDEVFTLADLGLESFFVRSEVSPQLGGPLGNPNGGIIEGDQFLNPATDQSFILTQRDQWIELHTGKAVEPNEIPVPGTFGILHQGDGGRIVLQPRRVLFQARPFLGLEESAIRRLDSQGFVPVRCVCAFLMHRNRPIALHVEGSDQRGLIVRVGKHPNNVVVDSVGVVEGQAINGPIEFQSANIRIAQNVRSFFSNEPIPQLREYRAILTDPQLREGESRFFSQLNARGELILQLDETPWTPGTQIEIDFLAGTPNFRKIALHFPLMQVTETLDAQGKLFLLAELLSNTLIERNLVPADNLRVAVDPAGNSLSFNFGQPLAFGKLDLCAIVPPPPPQITTTSTTAIPNGLIQINGRDFGKRMDDLCMVLVSTQDPTRTIPLRPVSLSTDGREILARVVGRINDGAPLRLMIARGIGFTQPVDLGVTDVIQRQGIWAWRGLGVTPASSPDTLTPALGQGEEQAFNGSVENGSLVVKINQAWPANARVRISFTANTETVQLDAYAPDLCFTVSGSTEDCADRIKRAIQRAFVQGGMASNNQVQVEVDVNGDEATITASVFTNQGANDPITSGHFDIYVSEESEECEPAPPEDSDGDYVQDEWETNNFGMEPHKVSAIADPDNDGLRNYMEFALHTDPNVPNGDFNPLQISLDDDDHPIIVYQRHVAAANFYNFDIETSPDGDQWERLVDIEVLQINDISDTALIVESRSNVSAIDLDAAYYRLRITPR